MPDDYRCLDHSEDFYTPRARRFTCRFSALPKKDNMLLYYWTAAASAVSPNLLRWQYRHMLITTSSSCSAKLIATSTARFIDTWTEILNLRGRYRSSAHHRWLSSSRGASYSPFISNRYHTVEASGERVRTLFSFGLVFRTKREALIGCNSRGMARTVMIAALAAAAVLFTAVPGTACLFSVPIDSDQSPTRLFPGTFNPWRYGLHSILELSLCTGKVACGSHNTLVCHSQAAIVKALPCFRDSHPHDELIKINCMAVLRSRIKQTKSTLELRTVCSFIIYKACEKALFAEFLHLIASVRKLVDEK